MVRSDPLVRVQDLTKVFSTRSGAVVAVSGVNLAIPRGQTVGLVGESGSGKSTVARLVMRLQEPTAGQVFFDGQDLAVIGRRELRELRRRMQMVFQNPFGSLLPHYTVANNVAEPLRLHGNTNKAARRAEAERLLELVGVNPRAGDLYPRQFSGGQQQRIAIARALALQPDLLVCDEPTSSLDVSVQAQILELLASLREKLKLSCLFISHNLGVVERLADTVVVMCQGRVLETAPTDVLFASAGHPYTRNLLAAVLPVSSAAPTIAETEPWDPRELDGPVKLVEVATGHQVLRPSEARQTTASQEVSG